MKKRMLIAISIAVLTIINCLVSVHAEEIYHTVLFNYNGISEAISVLDGDTVTPIADPTREGYVFSEWKDSRDFKAYDFSQPVTQNITLMAHWKQTEKKDLQQIVSGDKDQSDITHINPNEEFSLTPEKVKTKLTERMNRVSIGIAVGAIVMTILFVIAYNREKKSDRAIPTKKVEIISTGKCHRCGQPYERNTKRCSNCGATIFRKGRK